VVQRTESGTGKIKSIDKTDADLKRYRVASSVDAFDVERMIEDTIVMSINSEKNRGHSDFANLIRPTNRIVPRSDSDLVVTNDNGASLGVRAVTSAQRDVSAQPH